MAILKNKKEGIYIRLMKFDSDYFNKFFVERDSTYLPVTIY